LSFLGAVAAVVISNGGAGRSSLAAATISLRLGAECGVRGPSRRAFRERPITGPVWKANTLRMTLPAFMRTKVTDPSGRGHGGVALEL
jgi:hypothetical protein